MTTMNIIMRAVLAAAMAILLTGCSGISVNQSIRLADGETKDGSFTTVNGSVTVGRNCEIKGECQTVNGRIHVDDESTVGELGTVNGGIILGRGVTVDGDVSTVNGPVRCGSGTTVGGEVSTINGEIHLEDTRVAESVRTKNGDVRLEDGTRVGGDIVVEDNKGSHGERKELRIDIADGSVVEGDVVVHEKDLDVVVYLTGGGRVKGEVIGAKIVD